MKQRNTHTAANCCAALSIPVLWLALLIASCMEPGRGFFAVLSELTATLNNPLALTWNAYSLKAVGVSLILYGFAIALYLSTRGNRRPGEEHGSAKWGSAKHISAKYEDRKNPEQNIILTQNFKLGMDGHKHRRNLNTLVIGGSGSGKSRYFAMPNIMQLSSSYIITDAKGELLRTIGPVFTEMGIPITVLNIVDTSKSDGYNPFKYIYTDQDVFKLVNNLIKNTTPKESKSSEPFWEKAETTLLLAYILYLKYEAPAHEQNFAMVMYMLQNSEVMEENEAYQNPIDILFESLEEQNPEHIALSYYKNYRNGAPKTLKSILISASVRLAAFNLPEIVNMTNHDDMDFRSLGERKRAIFCVIPDSDTSMNFLVGLLYSQAFQEMYLVSDSAESGSLKNHISVILDEFANIALPDDFERILSTCRSRNIGISIIIQSIAQIKALFKDSYEGLISNCDSFLYLGSNEHGAHKLISEMLGPETLDTKTRGISRGRNGSSSENFQNAKRELLLPDEVRSLDNDYALLFIRGERPMLDKKYDLKRHPNYRYTAHAGAAPYAHNPSAQLTTTEEL